MTADLSRFDTYAAARAGFVWPQPARYNIATAACDAWADTAPDRTALVFADANGAPYEVSYGALQKLVNRTANAFAALGVGRGDRIAIKLGQRLETVAVHLAAYKLGAIAVPMAMLFGTEAMAYRLTASGARLLVTTAEGAATAPDCEATLVTVDGGPGVDLTALTAAASDRRDVADTGPDDPALIIFTSGTTGPPKGAVHGHRVLYGHMPGVQMYQDRLPAPGDRFWTPADWAWAGGLLNVLLPSLAMGVPVVAQRAARFDPDEALDWAAAAGVRNAFIPPTALRMMRDTRPRLALRSAGSAGEPLGAETFEWARRHLGVTINEAYGQTEVNLVLASCSGWGVAAPGIIGRAVPGHEVAIVDDAGRPLPDGTQGTIAVAAPDPVMFLGYWNDPAATAAKFRGRWMLTGDQGIAGPGGVRFVGRDDDLINSAGYRIGPGEIEDCLAGHPDVELAAVVGRPDALRGEVVVAFVKQRPGAPAGDEQRKALKTFVRGRLSAHFYPREIVFVSEIPLTTSGKVIRRAFREVALEDTAA
ncbi:AMP-binding protein [Acuticoccus yangtzensis]|uniref:AMP-binding protein n=1 Tax=Acuticoccus yangtzensis TaxID=1443441 RepID=UPI0009495931|nr:AMP-binding protein [Acuticoccus yangtzensis]ORE92568.1 acetyl-coenzyme A synthetase [Stappia sp. 22II-S9-Z10]